MVLTRLSVREIIPLVIVELSCAELGLPTATTDSPQISFEESPRVAAVMPDLLSSFKTARSLIASPATYWAVLSLPSLK